MAFAIDPASFYLTVLSDPMGAGANPWTTSNATITYSAGVLTFTDSSGAASGYGEKTVTPPTESKILIQVIWRWTSASSTPVVFQFGDTSGNQGVAWYLNSSNNKIYVRNGAGWTDSGVTLAVNTYASFEILIDQAAGTYRFFKDGVEIGTYTVDTTQGTDFESLRIGGGSSAAQEVYNFTQILVKQGLVSVNTLKNYRLRKRIPSAVSI